MREVLLIESVTEAHEHCDLGLRYGLRRQQPERKSLREGTGVDYARKIYRDESGRCGGVRGVGDGSRAPAGHSINQRGIQLTLDAVDWPLQCLCYNHE